MKKTLFAFYLLFDPLDEDEDFDEAYADANWIKIYTFLGLVIGLGILAAFVST